MAFLEVRDLTKSFVSPAGTLDVLKGIDLDVESGEVTAIVGASGVGKSTLLHILGTLDKPTSGKVFFEGTDVFGLGEDDLPVFRNRRVGFVFQFHHLLPEFTALENVMMPVLISGDADRKSAVERAEALLDELGLLARKDHRPGELSGGEQQRVSMARALVLNPDFVLADEPTGNLDSATGEALFGCIEAVNRKRNTTFLIATHNESLSRKCGRIVEMVDGSIRRA